jgi:hypothetical protein
MRRPRLGLGAEGLHVLTQSSPPWFDCGVSTL